MLLSWGRSWGRSYVGEGFGGKLVQCVWGPGVGRRPLCLVDPPSRGFVHQVRSGRELRSVASTAADYVRRCIVAGSDRGSGGASEALPYSVTPSSLQWVSSPSLRMTTSLPRLFSPPVCVITLLLLWPASWCRGVVSCWSQPRWDVTLPSPPASATKLACALRLWRTPPSAALSQLAASCSGLVPPASPDNLPWYYSRIGESALALLGVV